MEDMGYIIRALRKRADEAEHLGTYDRELMRDAARILEILSTAKLVPAR
jgi:hypothetical protein